MNTGSLDRLGQHSAHDIDSALHRCSSLFCSKCSASRGRQHRMKMRDTLAAMVSPVHIVVTVDQSKHASPLDAYRLVTDNRIISTMLSKRIGARSFGYTLQLQANGWPHWHIVCDAHGIDSGYATRDARSISATKVNGLIGKNGLSAVCLAVHDAAGMADYICRDFMYARAAKWHTWILELNRTENIRLVEFSRTRRQDRRTTEQRSAQRTASAAARSSVSSASSGVRQTGEQVELFDFDSLRTGQSTKKERQMDSQKQDSQKRTAVAKADSASHIGAHKKRNKTEKLAWCGLELTLIDRKNGNMPVLTRVPHLPEWLDECPAVKVVERMSRSGGIYRTHSFCSLAAAYDFAATCHTRYAEVLERVNERMAFMMSNQGTDFKR